MMNQRFFLSKVITTNIKAQAYSRRFPVQGFEVLQRWIHNSVSFEDDFVELGPPTIQGLNTRLKLATEKPETFKRTNDKLRNSSTQEDMIIPNAKRLLFGLGNFSRSSPKAEKPKNISKISSSSSSSKCKSYVKNSSSISIDNVPSAVNLSKLVEAVSLFGKISNAWMEKVADRIDSCVVEFVDEGSSQRAVSAGKITVESFHLPIRSLHVPDSVTIRIKDISEDTTYSAMHYICKKIGELVGIVKATENSIDVLFSIKELSDAQNILAELNNKIVDDCQWSAHLLAEPLILDAVPTNEMSELVLRVGNHISEIRNNFLTRKIGLEDLEYMHLAIMHLGEHHTVDTGSKKKISGTLVHIVGCKK